MIFAGGGTLAGNKASLVFLSPGEQFSTDEIENVTGITLIDDIACAISF